MRRKIVILATVGLALALSFSAPAVARADTTHGCGYIQAVGSEYYGGLEGDVLAFDGTGATEFCNVGISINGQFEIATENSSGAVTGCLAPNTTTFVIVEDSAAACALNGGAGYPWDRWTASSVVYHSQQLWLLDNPYVGGCMVDESQATWTTCQYALHDWWFSWPNSGL